jgi:hypothetical protein
VSKGVAFLDDPESRALLILHCERLGLDLSTIEQLVAEEVSVVGLERRDGLFQRMHEIIRESVGLNEDPDNNHSD